jgi:hypothetical protein
VRRHVVRAFGVVAVGGIAVRGEAGEDRLEIAPHVGVGVLAQDERRAGVLEKHGAGAGADAARRDYARDLGRDLRRAAAARVKGKRLLFDHW